MSDFEGILFKQKIKEIHLKAKHLGETVYYGSSHVPAPTNFGSVKLHLAMTVGSLNDIVNFHLYDQAHLVIFT